LDGLKDYEKKMIVVMNDVVVVYDLAFLVRVVPVVAVDNVMILFGPV
jgi:hypothetical protein